MINICWVEKKTECLVERAESNLLWHSESNWLQNFQIRWATDSYTFLLILSKHNNKSHLQDLVIDHPLDNKRKWCNSCQTRKIWSDDERPTNHSERYKIFEIWVIPLCIIRVAKLQGDDPDKLKTVDTHLC